MVGIDDSPPPPMELGEPGSAEFSGFEVDILETVAERLGLTLRYRRAVWSQILDELDRGLIDVVCTAATYTPERARQFDYGLLGTQRWPSEWSCATTRRTMSTCMAAASPCAARRPPRRTSGSGSLRARSSRSSTTPTPTRHCGTAEPTPSSTTHRSRRGSSAKRTGLRYLHSLPGTESHYAMMFAQGQPVARFPRRRGRARGRRRDAGLVEAAVVRRRLTGAHTSQSAAAITTVPITWATQKIARWVLWRQISMPAHPPACAADHREREQRRLRHAHHRRRTARSLS